MKKKLTILLLCIIAVISVVIVNKTDLFKSDSKDSDNEWVDNNIIGEVEVNDETTVFTSKECDDIYKNITSATVDSNGNVTVEFEKSIPKSIKNTELNKNIVLKPDSSHDVFSQGYAGKLTEINTEANKITLSQVTLSDVFDSIDIDTSKGNGDIEVLYVESGDEKVNINSDSKIRQRSVDGKQVTVEVGDNIKFTYTRDKLNTGKKYFKELSLEIESDKDKDKDDDDEDKNNDNIIDKIKDHFSFSGSISLEDLVIDTSVKKNGFKSPERKIDLACDVKNTLTPSIKLDKEFEEEYRIAYVLFGLGGVTVGSGDYNQPVSVGVAITLDAKGEVSVSANLEYTNEFYGEMHASSIKENNSALIKGKTYPHFFKPNEGGNKNDEDADSSLKFTGKLTGEIEEVSLNLKAMGTFMNFDVLAGKIGGGLSAKAEGEYSYDLLGKSNAETQVNSKEDKSLTYEISVDAIANFKLYTKALKDFSPSLKIELARKNLINLSNKPISKIGQYYYETEEPFVHDPYAESSGFNERFIIKDDSNNKIKVEFILTAAQGMIYTGELKETDKDTYEGTLTYYAYDGTPEESHYSKIKFIDGALIFNGDYYHTSGSRTAKKVSDDPTL